MINRLCQSNVCRITNCAISENAKTLQKECLKFFVEGLLKKKVIPEVNTLEKDLLVFAITSLSAKPSDRENGQKTR
uniref:Uncharacterized protein n=1 Tax=Panagrolaimus sp. ES5 TaxID=591445 RepID=A0AC34GHL1_9BILA